MAIPIEVYQDPKVIMIYHADPWVVPETNPDYFDPQHHGNVKEYFAIVQNILLEPVIESDFINDRERNAWELTFEGEASEYLLSSAVRRNRINALLSYTKLIMKYCRLDSKMLDKKRSEFKDILDNIFEDEAPFQDKLKYVRKCKMMVLEQLVLLSH